MPNANDLGESPADEPIDKAEHEFADWENRTHVMVEALREEGIIYTEELRAGIDALPSDLQGSLSYYETWSASVENLLVGKSIISKEEIDSKVREMDERWGANDASSS